MKLVFSFCALISAINLLAQSEEQAVIDEAHRMYRSEMASWYGSDIFVAEFKNKHERTGGYFSYSDGAKSICIFFSSDEVPVALATITFDSTYSTTTAVRDSTDRPLTPHETDLWHIRNTTQQAMMSNADKLFKFYEGTKPNIIPLADDLGKRSYILTGAERSGVVIFGNDYKLTFNDDNTLKEKKWLHKTMIATPTGPDKKGKVAVSGMHTHLPETGDYFTPTDLCTLMLYGRFTTWESYMVVGRDKVSMWKLKDKEPLSEKAEEQIERKKKKNR